MPEATQKDIERRGSGMAEKTCHAGKKMRKIIVPQKDTNESAKTLRDFKGVLKGLSKAVDFDDIRKEAKEQRALRLRKG